MWPFKPNINRLKRKKDIEKLAKALSIKDGLVVRDAAQALAEINDPRAVEPLIALLKAEDSYSRKVAADSLGEIGDPRAVEPLAAALSDDYFVREAAAVALDKICRKPANIADWILYLALTGKSDELIEIGQPAVKVILDELMHPFCPGGRARCLVRALGGIKGPDAIAALSTAFRHYCAEDAENIRKAALHELGEIGQPASETLLSIMKLVGLPHSDKISIIIDRGEIKDPSTTDALISTLKDNSYDIRQTAAHSLAKLKDERAVEPLVAALMTDSETIVRMAAADSLGEFKDPRAVEALITKLKDEDWEVRRCSAIALGKIKDPSAIEPLIAMLGDTGWSRLMGQTEYVGRDAAEALGEINDTRAVTPLIAALKDKRWVTRCGAALALGRIKDPRAVEPLRSGLTDEHPEVRKIAGDALRKICPG